MNGLNGIFPQSYYIKVSDLIHKLKSLLLSFRLIFIVALIMLGILLVLHIFMDIPIDVLTNDVAVVGDQPIYAGLLSQMGIFLWSATAAVCIYSLQFISNETHKIFIKSSIFVTIFLGLDDAFMFHETLFPSIGIHQKIVFLLYGFGMLYYLYKYYKLILSVDFLLFFFALGWFAISLFIDNFMYNTSYYISKLTEDITKFIGIVTWLLFFARTCKRFQKESSLEASRFISV